jgi:CubicO group peptidase (beta-lactamase class C family)
MNRSFFRALPLTLTLAACGNDTETPAFTPDARPPAQTSLTETERLDLEITLSSATKRLCSSVLVSGRTQEEVMSEELANPAPGEVDFLIQEDTVSGTARGMTVTALYRPLLGCTLVKDGSVDALRSSVALDRLTAPVPLADADWPRGDSVSLPGTVPGMDMNAVEAAIDQSFLDIDEDQDIDTRAVLIIKDGRIIAERYAAPFNASTPQLGWSMTKTVIGTLTGMLQEEGRLDVTAPAPVPEWRVSGDPRSGITLEHLLHMSSGLGFSEVYTAGSRSDVILMLYTTGDTAGFAIDQSLEHEPGSDFSYSSGTSNILSRILRDQFDDPVGYYNYPREMLFNRIGMSSAVMEPDESGTLVGSSYMYATPRDWARLGLLYLQDGVWEGERILPEGWVEYATTPAPAAAQGDYGAQIWLNAGPEGSPGDRPIPDLPANMVYLSGFEGQNILLFPDQDLVILRMGLTTRGPRPVWTLAEDVLRAMEP